MNTPPLTIADCRAANPSDTIDACLARIASHKTSDDDQSTWITVLTREQIQPYLDALQSPEAQPLYGVPFALKDNIDLAGVPTTAACPDSAFTPEHSAPVVQALIRAGAIPIGKTNMDQFATGLVGVRSPHGTARNPLAPDRIPGGSSSGSAVAVASGHVTFALGTDTAGSGRIPAAFNNLFGVKPTRGLLSTFGVIPACRSLDCVSIFANSATDARVCLDAATHFDPADSFARPFVAPDRPHPARPVIGIPREDQLEYFGDADYPACFRAACESLAAVADLREIDASPFLETADLLYGGPWVAERTAAIADLLDTNPDALHPVTRKIIEGGHGYSAIDAFRATYALAALRRRADALWDDIDILLTPTAGTHYTLEAVAADPVQTNTNLGRYMNFMNLLDLAALAIPAGFTADGRPFGVTVSAPAFRDHDLLRLAACWRGESEQPLVQAMTRVAVCGAHLDGFPLNHQLTERGGRLVAVTRTAARYRFFALETTPPKPALLAVDAAADDPAGGAAIEVEVWELPTCHYGSFVAGIPHPLGIGTIELEDGTWVQGFACDPAGLSGAAEITHLGSWRVFHAGEST